MKRFHRYLYQWLEVLHIVGDPVVLEWGHYTTKLAAKGVLIAEERSLAVVDEQHQFMVAIGQQALEKQAWQIEQFKQLSLVHNHLPTHIAYGADFLKLLLKKVQTLGQIKPGLVRGVCVLPASCTSLEKQLVQRVLAQSQTGVWSVMEVTQVALRVAQRHKLLQRMGGVLELGAQTSELILFLPNGQAQGITLQFGVGVYGVILQKYLREAHGVVVGDTTAQETIKQWGHSILSGHGESGDIASGGNTQATVVAIRAKALNSGKPTTTKFILEDMAYLFEEATAVGLLEMQAFFAARPASELEKVMEQGLVVTGGGALLPGLMRYLQDKLGLPLRVAPQPSSFLMTHYSSIHEQSVYES
jgi:rod shape-determining protein MreB